MNHDDPTSSVQELLERSERLEDHFLSLLRPDSESNFWSALSEFKRELHTLKGVCGMIGLREAAEQVHALEALLSGEGQHHSPETLGKVLEPPLQRLLHSLREKPNSGSESHSTIFAEVLKGDLLRQIQSLQKEEQTIRHLSYRKGDSGKLLKDLRRRLEGCSSILTGVPEVAGDTITFHFLVLDDPQLEEVVNEFQLGSQPFVWTPAQPGPTRGGGARLETSRLEELHQASSDLAAQFWKLKRSQALAGSNWDRFEDSVKDLQHKVQSTRLVRLENIFNRFPLETRAAARDQGKELQLRSEGGHLELDRDVAQGLVEPLRHLLLNAVSHGIESPAERIEAAKPAAGEVSLVARLNGSFLQLDVSDDGQGIDREKLSRECHRPLNSDQELLEQLCRPGWSTRTSPTLSAGRGLGLDIVARSLNRLRGSLSLQTNPGEGTTFSLTVPTSLAVLAVLEVEFGEITLAFARDSVQAVIPVEELLIARSGGVSFCEIEGHHAPLYDVAPSLDIPSNPAGWTQALLCRGMTGSVVLRIPPAKSMQEVVVQPCQNPFLASEWLDGITTLTSGSIAYLVSIPGLVERAVRANHR